MKNNILKLQFLTLLGIVFLLTSQLGFAQYNIADSYSWYKSSQKYLKVEIKKDGIYKIPFSVLPTDFVIKDPNKIQMYYRGKEVSIISTENSEITFYAVANDGARDSLLYRPMSSRTNKYATLYSEKAPYFLTIGEANGLRSELHSVKSSSTPIKPDFHYEDYLKVFNTDYSLSTWIAIKPLYINSYFEKGASNTGERIQRNDLVIHKVKLENLNRKSGVNPKLEIFIHGRSRSDRNIAISVGRDSSSLKEVGKIEMKDFESDKFNVEINLNDIREDGYVFIAHKSTSDSLTERYSIAYFKIRYTQNLSMNSQKSKVFNFEIGNNAVLTPSITGLENNVPIYDITTSTNPILIKNNSNGIISLESNGNKSRKIYVSGEFTTLKNSDLSPVNFKEINPKSYNYIIITTDPFKDVVEKYSAYRTSQEGGANSVYTITIKDIYDQFNYGEISPLGIRAFMNHMLSDGNRNKYLFIVGYSISSWERKVLDIEGEVPTIGYPASDILLVSGLAGAGINEPSVPVGRISVSKPYQVLDYLEKVKQYESNSNGDESWKKNVLHVSGGESAAQILEFKTAFESLTPMVTQSSFGGMVKPFAKLGLKPTEEVNITPEINEGVGMVSYLGHGSQYTKDNDFGFATKVERGYKNAGRYPLMYFNGCGVGNVFNGRINPDPNSGDKRMSLSLDWLLAKNKGAIAIIGNSYESFSSTSKRYLDVLYKNLFIENQSEVLSIGKIQQNTIRQILAQGYVGELDVSNIHQSVLQGDPAIKLIIVSKPDYSISKRNSIKILAQNNANTIEASDSLNIVVYAKNGGRYIEGQTISVLVEGMAGKDVISTFSKQISAYQNQDTISFTIPNFSKQFNNLRVSIDPEKKIVELSKLNNTSELFIDWSVANKEKAYPFFTDLVDQYPPILEVKFDNRLIESGQVIRNNPNIKLFVTDDSEISGDPSLINIFIKGCEDITCEYIKLERDYKIVRNSDNSFSVEFEAGDFAPGLYLLRAEVSDHKENVAAYTIKFKISEEDVSTVRPSVTISPNPSSTYVKFSIKSGHIISDTFKVEVFNMLGNLVYSNNIVATMGGTDEHYWYPNISAGIYIYKVTYINQSNETANLSGKFVFTK